MKLINTTNYLLLIDEEAEILCRYKEILLSKDESLLCRITETNHKQHFRGINIVSNVEVAISYHQTNDFYKVIAYHPLTKEAKELDLPLIPPIEEVIPNSGYEEGMFGYTDTEVRVAQNAFKEGWNKHAEKYKFTEEDVKKAIQLAREADSIDGVVDLPIVLNYPNADNSDLQIKWTEEEIIQFLQQPKEIIEIEFETEEYAVGNYGLSDGEPTIDTRLKITKSIKYPNGLLTIKNVKYE